MPRQHLTPNACLICRKKRTKCDGQIPCRRCRARGEECTYEDKKWRTKDHLRSEIERLRAEQRQGHAVIRALIDNDPKQWEAVQARLRSDEPPEIIAKWIHSVRNLQPTQQPTPGAVDNPKYKEAAPRLLSPFQPPAGLAPEPTAEGFQPSRLPGVSTYSFAPPGNPFDNAPRVSFSTDLSPDSSVPFRDYASFPQPSVFPSSFTSTREPLLATRKSVQTPTQQAVLDEPLLRTWTSITSDTELVQRLLANFFSGSFHSHCLISPPQFMRDMRSGDTRFCSEALVNAILGKACRSADATSRLMSRVTYGDAFLGEAKRLLAAERSHVNLPSIQALGLLSLAEVSRGNDDEAWELAWESVRASIHLALQTQPQDNEEDEDYRAVRATSYCGGFTLVRMLRLLTGRLEPKTGPLFMKLRPDPEESGDDAPHIRVERGISLQQRFFAELQYCQPLARFVFEVTEAVHTFSSYNFAKAMTSEDLESAYEKCLDYYKQFVETFDSDIDGSPDLLYAQIWYHYCLLSLLRPFIDNTASLKDDVPPKLRDDATPHTVCQQSSEAIIFLTSTYQTRYTFNHLPVLLPHMVFAAVLYQLTVALESTPPQTGPLVSEMMAESPTTMSQQHTGNTRYNSPQRQAPPHAPSALPQKTMTTGPGSGPGSMHSGSSCLPQPLSPTIDLEVRMASAASRAQARRRPSGLSVTTSVPGSSRLSMSSDRRPSISTVGTSYAASEHGSAASSDTTATSGTSADMLGLPLFTSEPGDLVTIGTLQLASMGAQHHSAVEAASLLRAFTQGGIGSGSTHDLIGGVCGNVEGLADLGGLAQGMLLRPGLGIIPDGNTMLGGDAAIADLGLWNSMISTELGFGLGFASAGPPPSAGAGPSCVSMGADTDVTMTMGSDLTDESKNVQQGQDDLRDAPKTNILAQGHEQKQAKARARVSPPGRLKKHPSQKQPEAQDHSGSAMDLDVGMDTMDHACLGDIHMRAHSHPTATPTGTPQQCAGFVTDITT